MELLKEKRILEKLQTERNTWHNVILFKTKEEAKNDGYGLMYDDREGVVFGIMRGVNCWDTAFVPKENLYDKYASLANVEKIIDRDTVSAFLEASVNELFIKCQDKLGITSGDIEPFMAIELDGAIKNLSENISKVLTYQLETNKGNEISEVDYEGEVNSIGVAAYSENGNTSECNRRRSR